MADPFDDFFAGTEPPPRRKTPEMEGKALEIASRLREMFYQYTARQDRSQQTTLGPSEIGSPCDRRLALSLLGVPAVNPGGDGWAAFKGTWVHAGLAEMFKWANAGTGRYATEVPVALPSPWVPRGTCDLLDRTMLLCVDHKLLGSSSLSKLRFDGPPPRYRVQVHVYAHGARLAGEQVDDVAVVAWPAEAQTLSGLYVWTEPFDEGVATGALARVERIAARLYPVDGPRHSSDDYSPAGKLHVSKAFPTADDCKFCSWHSKTEAGCSGHEG